MQFGAIVPVRVRLGKIAWARYDLPMNKIFILTLVLSLIWAVGAAQSQTATVETAAKRFSVTLEEPERPVSINVMHSRIVRITAPNGAAIADAKIKVDGGMAAHGHGLPTAPQATQYLGDGRYLIEGVKFNMGGKWQLKLSIDAAGQSDTASFELTLK